MPNQPDGCRLNDLPHDEISAAEERPNLDTFPEQLRGPVAPQPGEVAPAVDA